VCNFLLVVDGRGARGRKVRSLEANRTGGADILMVCRACGCDRVSYCVS
jgi:hypothetical protein